MKIQPFALERYFAKYEFSAPLSLSPSDCEPLKQKELLALADSQTKKMWDELSLGYTRYEGLPELREEVIKFYTKITPENVLVVVPEEGIFLTMYTLLEKGDHIITTFPGYQSLYEVAGFLGCEVTKWTPNEEKNWEFDLEFLKSSIKPNTRLLSINFPHNPTGALPDKKTFSEILNIAREKNIYVFSDEMYRFLEYNPADLLPSASDLYENAISLFGVSKTFALAGARIGWLTSQNKEVFDKIAQFKDYTTICNSAPSEILALMALRAKDQVISRSLEIIHDNVLLLDTFFQEHKDTFSWVKPKAGTIAFPKVTLKKDMQDFCLDFVAKKGVMLMSSTVYGYKGNNVRFGFGRKDMPQALGKLEEYLQENYA